MSDALPVKSKPIWIPGDLHTGLKIKAAQMGRPLGELAAEKLGELLVSPGNDGSERKLAQAAA